MKMTRHLLTIALATSVLAGQSPVAALLAADESGVTGGRSSHVEPDIRFSPVIPDVPVQDQNGRALRFHSDLVKNKTVAINFIFTSCTTICPPLTTAMRAIQRQLADRVGTDVWLISVSVDPTVDRPARLKAFADDFGAGPGWTFVTGKQADIDRLLKAFGSYSGSDVNAHASTMLIGNDRTNRWIRTNGLAPLKTNAELILEAARGANSNRASP
jgi:cytochrome oxidase Cu insertion factor (SCO1/SenC/PrrC family)